jgi:hypothetical protein
MYIRTRKLESSILRNYNQVKRGFEAIGWYCKRCKMFETDEMICRRSKETFKDRLAEYEKLSASLH